MIRTLVIVASSTGGPRTLQQLLGGLPPLDAAFVVVQHMPAYINDSLCHSLARATDMEVTIPADGEELREGTVYLARSEVHLELTGNRRVALHGGDKVNFVCPSADVTMKSVVADARLQMIGVVLTGMGKDGAAGIEHLKRLGATTIAQEASSCVVNGMPRAAVETGCVDLVLPPAEIGSTLTRLAA
jgi:two-component system chemotaxis response regulator CheB